MMTVKSRLLLASALCGVVAFSGCNPHVPHQNGVYQIETSDLQKVLTLENNEKFQPPKRLDPTNTAPVLHTYVLVKINDMNADEVALQFSPQESELLMTSENLNDEMLSKFPFIETKVPRKDFDSIGSKLLWITDSKSSKP